MVSSGQWISCTIKLVEYVLDYINITLENCMTKCKICFRRHWKKHDENRNPRDVFILLIICSHLDWQLSLLLLLSPSWPLGVLGKLIPVPETPLSSFFTRAFCCRWRTSRSILIIQFSFYFIYVCLVSLIIVHWLFFFCWAFFSMIFPPFQFQLVISWNQCTELSGD